MVTTCRDKRKSPHGLFIETCSGTKSGLVCRLGSQPDADIKHIVNIKNKKLFPVRIECVGLITSNPRSVMFHCHPPHPLVSEDRWEAQTRLDGNKDTTRSTTLRSNDRSEPATVEARVVAKSPRLPGGQTFVKASFEIYP